METPTDDLDSALRAFEAQFQVDKCELKRQMHEQMDMQLELWSSKMMNKFKLMVVNCHKLNSNVNSTVNCPMNSNSINSNVNRNVKSNMNSNRNSNINSTVNSRNYGIANGSPRKATTIDIPTPNNNVVSILPSSSSAFQAWSRDGDDDDEPMDSIDSAMFDDEDSTGFNRSIPCDDDDEEDSEGSVILCDPEDPQDEDQKPSTSSEQNPNTRNKNWTKKRKRKGRSLRRSPRVRKRPLTYSENLYIESDSDSDFIILKSGRVAAEIGDSSTRGHRSSSSSTGQRSYSKIIYINCTHVMCKQKLNSREEYETHMAIHGILPYRCTVQTCGQSFAQHPELIAHYRSAHSHLLELPCHSCTQTYRSLGRLLVHLRSVHEPGQYGCVAQDCAFTAPISHTVYLHYVRTHLENHQVKRHICDFPNCGKRFPGTAALIEHQYLHLKIRPYLCRWPDCDHSASQKPGLYYHIMNEHFHRDKSLKSRIIDYVGIMPQLLLSTPIDFSVIK